MARSGSILLLTLALALVADRSTVVAYEDLFDDILSIFFDSESESESMELIQVDRKNATVFVTCDNCTLNVVCPNCSSMTTAGSTVGMGMAPTSPAPRTTTGAASSGPVESTEVGNPDMEEHTPAPNSPPPAESTSSSSVGGEVSMSSSLPTTVDGNTPASSLL